MTAQEGSFSAAARVLGLAQPTLGRQVAALEEELGVVLFERNNNRLTLTETGLNLVEHVRTMNDAATALSLIAAGQTDAIDGTVRIAASEAMSAYVLPPVVQELRRLYPGIDVELVVSNASSDLRRREADIAIRHFRPTGDDLVARLVKDDGAAYLYATPGYLRRIGNPETPEELGARGSVIAFDGSDAIEKRLRAQGLPFGPDSFPIRTDNYLVQWELCKRGVGMCAMMEEIGDREPRVRRALVGLPPSVSFPTWITSHRELKTNRRIRAVFDLLAERLAETSAS